MDDLVWGSVCRSLCVHASAWACVSVCMGMYMHTASSDAFSAPPDSEPSIAPLWLYHRHPRKNIPFADGLECTLDVGASLDWGPSLFPKCPPVGQTTYSEPDTLTLIHRMFSLPLLQGPLLPSFFLRGSQSQGF